MKQDWQRVDDFMLGDGYLGIHYIILSAFKYVQNVPKQKVEEKKKKEGGRQGEGRKGEKEGAHEKGRPYYTLAYIWRGGHVMMTLCSLTWGWTHEETVHC